MQRRLTAILAADVAGYSGLMEADEAGVAAVDCALAIQGKTMQGEPGRDEATSIRYRIGINLGDVIVEGDDIYGDGVNVAARLQALAPVDGIAVSLTVRNQVAGKAACTFEDLGEHTVAEARLSQDPRGARPS